MELKAEQADAFKAVLEEIAASDFHEGQGGCHGFCPVCAAKEALHNFENRKYLHQEVYMKGWDDGYEAGYEERGKREAEKAK